MWKAGSQTQGRFTVLIGRDVREADFRPACCDVPILQFFTHVGRPGIAAFGLSVDSFQVGDAVGVGRAVDVRRSVS